MSCGFGYLWSTRFTGKGAFLICRGSRFAVNPRSLRFPRSGFTVNLRSLRFPRGGFSVNPGPLRFRRVRFTVKARLRRRGEPLSGRLSRSGSLSCVLQPLGDAVDGGEQGTEELVVAALGLAPAAEQIDL